jgi:TonB family protein
MSIKFLERIKAQNALEEEYPRDLNLAFTVSLIFFILLFLFGRGCAVEAYKPKTQQEVMGEEINMQAQLEEPPPPPAPTQTVLEAIYVDEPPQPIVLVQPEYPEVARKAGLEGKVIVAAVVDENGNVIEAYIHQSTNPIFNEAALKAAKKMKYKPGRQKDIPVKVKVLIPFVFRLTK